MDITMIVTMVMAPHNTLVCVLLHAVADQSFCDDFHVASIGQSTFVTARHKLLQLACNVEE